MTVLSPPGQVRIVVPALTYRLEMVTVRAAWTVIVPPSFVSDLPGKVHGDRAVGR